MSELFETATILASVAGLWAIAFAWLTYVMTVRIQKEDRYVSLKSIVQGLRTELELMEPWTGYGGPGYSKNLQRQDCPEDWWNPSRIIWKFPWDTIRGLPASPYVHFLKDIINPFVRLNFAISKLFQLYDEYRTYVMSRPQLYDAVQKEIAGVDNSGSIEQKTYRQGVFAFNYKIHKDVIGGNDSRQEACFYKAYSGARAALDQFENGLKVQPLPGWFLIGHMIAVLAFGSGRLSALEPG